MMYVGLRHLHFIVPATHYGSLRHAAGIPRVRQSTHSRAVQQLETRGVILFERSSAGVRPTPAGSHFVGKAKRLLADFGSLLSSAGTFGKNKSGLLTLGLPTSLATARLRTVLLDYARDCPAVDIRLVARQKSALLADFMTDIMDVTIVVGAIGEPDCDSLSFWSEGVLATVPCSRPLPTRPFAYWTDLTDEVVLMSRRGLGPS